MDTLKLKHLLFIAGAIGLVLIFSRVFNAVETIIPEKIVIISVDKTGLFSQKSETSLQLIALNKGDKLEVLDDTDENWFKVTQGQFTGYISTKVIDKSFRYKEQE